MVLLVMCVGYFLVLLDVTIVNVALPHIAAGLHAGVSDLQWVVDGYAIALAALMLAGGAVGDLHGHKRVVLTGLAVFGLGSAGCGLAPGVEVLVAARVVQGAGAALLLPGTLAIVTHEYPGARAIGVWAGVGSAALPAGPVLGGALVSGIGWRAVFFLNLPIVAVALPVAARVVRESTDPGGRRLDVAGSALAAALLAAVTYALIERSLVAAAVAVVALAAFVAVERRPDPMLPLELLRRPAFTIANGAAGTMNLCTLGMLFVVTLFLQDVQGRGALEAGLVLLPLFAPLTVIAPLAGRLVARAGPRRPMVAGLLISAAGLALLALISPDTGAVALIGPLLLWGGGLGILTPAVVAGAMGAVAPERAGLASAVNNTARQAGGAVGIAAFGALAGAPGAHSRFMHGLHAGALVAAGLYVVAAVVSASGAAGLRRPARRPARSRASTAGSPDGA
jgi:DHA2 family methylenomycin A resistance protein-like MFS transporter